MQYNKEESIDVKRVGMWEIFNRIIEKKESFALILTSIDSNRVYFFCVDFSSYRLHRREIKYVIVFYWKIVLFSCVNEIRKILCIVNAVNPKFVFDQEFC